MAMRSTCSSGWGMRATCDMLSWRCETAPLCDELTDWLRTVGTLVGLEGVTMGCLGGPVGLEDVNPIDSMLGSSATDDLTAVDEEGVWWSVVDDLFGRRLCDGAVLGALGVGCSSVSCFR